MWICTSPIATNLEEIYGLSLLTVNFCTSLIWFVIYVPMNFVANYVLDQIGLRAGILLGSILTLIGLWIRVLSEHSFYYIFAGQILGAIAQPLICNAPQKLSAFWFPSNQRAISTTIASVANPVGVGIGFLIAQGFVSNDAKGQDGLKQVRNLMFGTAVLGSIMIAPVLVFFKNRPVSPPSKSADTEKYSYKKSLKNLFGNWNYLLFIISTGLFFGLYNVLATVLQPILKPFGYTNVEAGNFGAVTIVAGLIGSIVVGVYVDKTKKYKKSILVCSIISTIAAGGLVAILPSGNGVLFGIVCGICGFFATPVFPLSFEFCAELSFPVAEAASGGLMVVMTQIVAAFGTVGVTAILDAGTKKNALLSFIIFGTLFILGILGYIFTKEDLKRTRHENQADQPLENIELAKNDLNFDDEARTKIIETKPGGMSHLLDVKSPASPTQNKRKVHSEDIDRQLDSY